MSYIHRTCCALIALAAASTPVAAQQADTTLEEIIVTAQKRAESLQDTPISIAAVSARDLENNGINDLTDLQSEVPNLQVTPHPNSATTAKIFLRGVGNNDDQVTQDPSVAVYLDGVYVARNQGLAMEVAELERIEVLRGPQGSLYGRNATGGAINFITRAPQLGAFEAEQKLSFGNYDQFVGNAMRAMQEKGVTFWVANDEERASVQQAQYIKPSYDAWYRRAEQVGFDGHAYIERVRKVLGKEAPAGL